MATVDDPLRLVANPVTSESTQQIENQSDPMTNALHTSNKVSLKTSDTHLSIKTKWGHNDTTITGTVLPASCDMRTKSVMHG